MEELYRLDLLPAFKQTVEIGSVSSYDRTGGNDDGFSGKYSYLRREGDALVIADLKGPGVITRIWTPTPTDDLIEFYFDGAVKPALTMKFSDLFSGKHFPFLSPVAGSGAGGFYSYAPIPYRESCKVVVRAERLMFYQINFARYAPAASVVSYPEIPRDDYARHLARAQKLFSLAGQDVSGYAAGATSETRTLSVRKTVTPDTPATLFELTKPGRIVGLRLTPANAFAGKARDIVLRAYWDGDKDPAINAPVTDLFGYSFGEPAMHSLLAGTSGDINYLYLPMPYDRSARIELVSERTGSPIEVTADIVIADRPRQANEGKLYAVWRRENPTTTGEPFTFLNTGGRGHVVGFILQAQGLISGNTEFFEGDDQTTIDGKLAIHGTGSEDLFNGGWYDVPDRWEKRVSFPLSGSLDYRKPLARTGGFRFLLADIYAFSKSINFTIEHGPSGNQYPTDYTGVTFLYSDRHPAPHTSLPPASERRVRDLDAIVFIPGWNVPIDAFSMQNATLEKRDDKINGENIRYLSMRARDRDVFGTHYISFLCEAPAAGEYEVAIEAIKGPEQGSVQLYRNDLPVGEAVTLLAAERTKSGVVRLATVPMQQGPNRVLLKIKSLKGEGGEVRLDLSKILLTRVQEKNK